MTSQKTISSLSVAAIALLIVAAPALAQAQADRAEQSSYASMAGEQTIVSNTELVAGTKSRVATPAIAEVERTGVNSTTRTVSPLRFSASSFLVQNHFTSATSSQFAIPQPSFNYAGPSDPTAKKQFRADDADSACGIKPIAFVPSRGPKLPE